MLKAAHIAKGNNRQSLVNNHQSSINNLVQTANHPPMSLLTLNDIFSAVVERDDPRVMMYRESGRWLPISSRELYQKVAGVSRALTSWGFPRGIGLRF